MRRIGLAAALALPWSVALACGEELGAPARRIDAAQFQLAYRLLPDPVPVGRHVALEIVLCPQAGAAWPTELRVDATMPAHRHGMNYRPSVSALAPGRYRAEGLMFHMPGRWELVFELRGAGAPQRLTQSLQVE
ncbi:MAG: hypothetical protein KF720_01070 [Rubrivivax sp.]|nr:hypothetical protein [Rubrivivax sp.]